MPRMQVTFNNVSRPSTNLTFTDYLSTLMFQIEYRGKRYNCVGHLRKNDQSEEAGHSRISFSGYYGYNGPIDIQKLRAAAIDYYRTITGESDAELRLVQPNIKRRESIDDLEPEFTMINKSYEFNVGAQDNQAR